MAKPLNIPSFINRANRPKHNKSLSQIDFHSQQQAGGNVFGIGSNNRVFQNGAMNHNIFRGAPNSYLGSELGDEVGK